MMRVQTFEAASSGRQPLLTETFRGYKTVFFDSPGGEGLAPQGFLVEQDPGWILNTHFHLQHQFQVVVRGGGTLGRHPVSAMSVHYASPESGYGPITAGPEGLWYFTLRAVHDTGSWHLPKHRARMRPGLKKRHAMGHAAISGMAPGSEGLPEPLRETVIEPVIEQQDDAMAAWLLRIPRGSRFVPPPDDGGTGRFYLVGRGAMDFGGRRLPQLSLLFVSADETDFVVQAGEEGLEVLVLQFGRGTLNAPEPQSHAASSQSGDSAA